jgi:choloylglycine hydrolase
MRSNMTKTKDGSIVHGRTVEFGITIDTSVVVFPHGYEFFGDTAGGDEPNNSIL